MVRFSKANIVVGQRRRRHTGTPDAMKRTLEDIDQSTAEASERVAQAEAALSEKLAKMVAASIAELDQREQEMWEAAELLAKQQADTRAGAVEPAHGVTGAQLLPRGTLSCFRVAALQAGKLPTSVGSLLHKW